MGKPPDFVVIPAPTVDFGPADFKVKVVVFHNGRKLQYDHTCFGKAAKQFATFKKWLSGTTCWSLYLFQDQETYFRVHG